MISFPFLKSHSQFHIFLVTTSQLHIPSLCICTHMPACRWVNRKDPNGKNIFSGGFLGLDNIGIFDRSRPLPTGGELEQADGTAWMAFFCVTMLDIALELALHDDVYEDMASKFFEHFVSIVDAMNQLSGGVWG